MNVVIIKLIKGGYRVLDLRSGLLKSKGYDFPTRREAEAKFKEIVG